MTFVAKDEIELQNVIAPPAHSLSLKSQKLVIGLNCSLEGPASLTVNDVDCP